MKPFRRRQDSGPPEGLIPAEKLAEAARRGPPPSPPAVADADLVAVFYEMAIRDSLREDVLLRRAAELQEVDLELAQVERLLAGHDPVAGLPCPSCGAVTGRSDAFCAQCATPLQPAPATNGSAAP